MIAAGRCARVQHTACPFSTASPASWPVHCSQQQASSGMRALARAVAVIAAAVGLVLLAVCSLPGPARPQLSRSELGLVYCSRLPGSDAELCRAYVGAAADAKFSAAIQWRHAGRQSCELRAVRESLHLPVDWPARVHAAARRSSPGMCCAPPLRLCVARRRLCWHRRGVPAW